MSDAMTDPMTDPIFHVWADRPASKWLDASPVGNGRIGAMVFGRVFKEYIGLNEETVWTRQAPGRLNPDARAHLDDVRRLLLDDEPLEAQFLAEASLFGRPHYQSTYQTLGTLKLLTLGHHEERMSDYRRETDLRSGVATVSYTIDGVRHRREIFVSAPDDVLVVRLTADTPTNRRIAINVFRKQDALGTTRGDDTFELSGRCGSRGTVFTAALKVMPGDGDVRAVGDHLLVDDAGATTLVFGAATDFRHADHAEVAHRTVDAAARREWDDLRHDHITDHAEKMDRVVIRLPEPSPDLASAPTADRLQALRDGRSDPALLATFFQFGRYLLLGSSRPGTLPANLQGIWNEHYIPGWDSKFTININAQMNYWPAEVAGLTECHEPLFDLLDRVAESGRETAKVHYGCRGFVAHHNTDLWADTAPLDNVNCGLWPLGGAWLALHTWDHYEFTLDEEFLRERAYPILLDAARFLLDFMFEHDGTLQIGPTLSPENAYDWDGVRVAICMNPASDVQLTRALFDRIRRAAHLLDIDDPIIAELDSALLRLPPHRIGEHGRLLEWAADLDEWEPGHRHFSHLIGIYPDDQLLDEQQPGLASASLASLQHRIDNSGVLSTDRSGTPRYTAGWTWAWSAALYARLGRPDAAEESLRQALMVNTSDSLLITSPPGGTNPLTVFQIDGNLGSVAAIAEMIVQSHGGVVRLAPAIPRAWPSGSATGLRLRGGVIVDIAWADGRITEATLTVPGATDLAVTVPSAVTVNAADGTDELVQAGTTWRTTADSATTYHLTAAVHPSEDQ